MARDCCSGPCGTTLLLLVIGTALLAAGTATDYWLKDGDSLHWKDFPSKGNNNTELNITRGCLLAALGCAAIVLLIYFCFCCCNERRRSVLAAQFVLLLLAATGAAAGVVVWGLWRKDSFKDFGWSYWVAVAGAALYVLNLFLILADCCCCGNRSSV